MESTEESGGPYEAERDQDAGQPDHTDSPQPDESQGTPDDAGEAGDEAGEPDKSAAPTESSAEDITSPGTAPQDATQPPSNPEVDEDAVERGKERLEQAGSGH